MVKSCTKCGVKDRNKYGQCRLCKRLADTKYRKENCEKIKLTKYKYRKVNSEKIKVYMTKWRRVNHKKQKLAVAKWRKANPEKVKLFTTNWQKANLEVRRIHYHNYYARLRTNGGKLSTNLAKILYKEQKGKCACCQEPLGNNYHLDHIMPLILGGKNEDQNVQLLIAKCNMSKGGKHPIEYAKTKMKAR